MTSVIEHTEGHYEVQRTSYGRLTSGALSASWWSATVGRDRFLLPPKPSATAEQTMRLSSGMSWVRRRVHSTLGRPSTKSGARSRMHSCVRSLTTGWSGDSSSNGEKRRLEEAFWFAGKLRR